MGLGNDGWLQQKMKPHQSQRWLILSLVNGPSKCSLSLCEKAASKKVHQNALLPIRRNYRRCTIKFQYLPEKSLLCPSTCSVKRGALDGLCNVASHCTLDSFQHIYIKMLGREWHLSVYQNCFPIIVQKIAYSPTQRLPEKSEYGAFLFLP